MNLNCQISPISGFLSTSLNNSTTSYDDLITNLLYALGAPMVNVELHRDQILFAIKQATDFFTKYAGQTEEYLIFNSDLYEKKVGVKLDTLFTLRHIIDLEGSAPFEKSRTNMANTQEVSKSVYVCKEDFSKELFKDYPSLSALITEDMYIGQVINETLYNELDKTGVLRNIEECFKKTENKQFNVTNDDKIEKYNPSFDYDLMDYRKVVNVKSIDQGSTTGINTLFTIESVLAQQTYFSYAMGNYGFDLVSWYTLKNWLETREKVLAQQIEFTFDKRTQYLKIYPEPKNATYWAVLTCWVERPLRDIIKERWVYDYALAWCKILLAQVRGKYTSINVFGGTSLHYDSIKSEGVKEKEELEKKLLEGAAAGFGDMSPPMWFCG